MSKKRRLGPLCLVAMVAVRWSLKPHSDLDRMQNGIQIPLKHPPLGTVVPDPNRREANMAIEGQLDLDQIYANSYREGWDLAFQDYRKSRSFDMATKDDAHEWFDSIGIGVDGFRDGYVSARHTIEKEFSIQNP